MDISVNPNRQIGDIPNVDEILSMEKALSERPSFSIRIRITIAFIIAVLFSFSIGVSSMFYISIMNSKQNFFDHATKFAFTVEQARRHEKNFFLYHARTDLFDALSNIKIAATILQDTANEMQSLLKRDSFKKLSSDLSQYERLMRELSAAQDTPGNAASSKNPDIESQLRIYGHEVLNRAMDLMDQERAKFHEAANTFMLAAAFSLIINFIVMIWVAAELARQILQPLGRFVQYTNRIAGGDFSLINPKRTFRDEFSNLAVAINRMIFELMEKHKQLVQSRKMSAVGTLTSGIAHELNNPLNNISITTEALLENLDGFTRDEILEMLQEIFVQVDRAGGTVRNLLDFTRLGQSRVESIDASVLIQSSLNLVKNECLLKGIQTETDISENLPYVKGNFRNLQQVFLNLLLNGIQAMQENGIFLIHAAAHDEKFVVVDFTDNGCGISKKNLERVFDPFFTTKDVGRGTGLGLSVSYGIIQEIGGRIGVDSKEGSWTTFSVYLPVADGGLASE